MSHDQLALIMAAIFFVGAINSRSFLGSLFHTVFMVAWINTMSAPDWFVLWP